MAKYAVELIGVPVTTYVTVEAESDDEAIQIASRMDIGLFGLPYEPHIGEVVEVVAEDNRYVMAGL